MKQPTASGKRRTPMWLVCGAALICLLSSLIAFNQDPHPNAFRSDIPFPQNLVDADWWTYPREANAFKRLPVIPSSLNDLYAAPDGLKLWAVGNKGLIVHSADGGKTWTQQNKQAQTTKQESQPPAKAASRASSRWVNEAHAEIQLEVGKGNADGENLPPSTPSNLSMEIAPGPVNRFNEPPAQQTEPQGIIEDPSFKSAPNSIEQQTIAPQTQQAPVQQTIRKKPRSKPQPPKRQIPQKKESTPINLNTVDLNGITCVGDLTCWAVGESGTILATTDGGQTWAPQASGAEAGLTSVTFISGSQGWAVGESGTILATTDGGQTWAAQPSGTRSELFSVTFISGSQGWAVGESGTILATTDGGQTWAAQPSGTRSELFSVTFISGSQGWAVGESGTILATTDGGQTWAAQPSGTRSELFSVTFISGSQGWAVGESGTILATTDGGQTWAAQPSGTRSELFSVTFISGSQGWAVGTDGTILSTIDRGAKWIGLINNGLFDELKLMGVSFVSSTQGWVVGEGGTILATQNGGQSWVPQTSGSKSWLYDVKFFSPTQGWAVGESGTILATADGGITWTSQVSKVVLATLTSVDFVSPSQGWVVGSGGTILGTKDGGITWTAQRSGTSTRLQSVEFVSPSQGWITMVSKFSVGFESSFQEEKNGTILATTDGGITWVSVANGPDAWLEDIAFVSSTQGWVVGENGTILVTKDGGLTWSKQGSGTTSGLFSVDFISETRGWAVGTRSTILGTEDGGKTWKKQTGNPTTWLRSVDFVSSTEGWVVGSSGTILVSRDGGKTWNSSMLYRQSPAPWYWLPGWGLPLLLLVIAFRMVPGYQTLDESVSGALVSDRPLEAGDPDPLKFSTISNGLSRFLRHEKTKPPLTIAITGDWGTGKSSLMNLLKADLARFGFRPVWFNAWHHQKEEHLLAALLEAIRTSSVPPWWHPANWRFRSRLLALRLKKHLMSFLAFGALYGVALGYLFEHPDVLQNLFNQLLNTQGESYDFLSLLTKSVPVLGLVWRTVVAFGTKPASLLASLSGKTRLRDLSAQTGFRQAFAREFGEVCGALNPRHFPIVMIDDLDRCQPDKVLEVLEAINFLVSSGDCVVVMGLALDRVERCVGVGFKDVAEEFADEPHMASDGGAGKENESDSARDKRTAFARQYLEKLINIEVPVPVPTSQQSAALVASLIQRTNPLEQAVSFMQHFGRTLQRLLPIGMLLVVVCASVFVGKTYLPNISGPSSNVPPELGGKEKPAEAAGQSKKPIYSGGNSITESTPDSKSSKEQPVLRPGEASNASIYWPGLILGIVLGSGLLLFFRQTDAVEKDSPEFVKALKFWLRILHARHPTPRALKRFFNRLRYLAMFQKQVKVQSVGFERLWALFNGKSDGAIPPSPVTPIPEKVLVALSTIHDFQPSLIENPQEFRPLLEAWSTGDIQLGNVTVRVAPPFEEGSNGGPELLEGIPDWGSLATHRDAFLERMTGIQVH